MSCGRWVVWDEWCEMMWDELCEMRGVRWVVWDELEEERRRRRRRRWKEPGVSDQKQKPHTQMWGIIIPTDSFRGLETTNELLWFLNPTANLLISTLLVVRLKKTSLAKRLPSVGWEEADYPCENGWENGALSIKNSENVGKIMIELSKFGKFERLQL